MVVVVVLLLALLFLSLLISFISSKRMISFSRLVDTRRGIDSRPYFASLGFLQRNVLILSSEQDIAVFAKSQAANDRGEAFVACLGVGWNVVGRHMLGACDADRHAVLAQVFKPAINRSLHQNKDKIADLVSQFVRNLPQTFDLRNGVFDGMIARVLSLICFGSSCDEREISYFVEQHRKLVLPLLRDSRARWPVIGPLLVHGNKSRVERLVNVEFVQFLAALQDDSEVLRQARAAVETGMISKLEMLQTMWELLFFNVDIGEAEIIGLCVELSKHKLDPNDVELLDAFINESARLHPGVEITFPEALGNDTVFSGQSYPKGTLVSFDVVKFNLRVGKDFDPSRRPLFYRFGLGGRACAGQSLARLMLRTFVVEVLRRFEFVVVDEQGSSSESGGLSVLIPTDRAKVMLKSIK